ncbi:MAG: hypothetical protein ACR2P0_13325 [Acidimicrobiales bacterium]
MSQITLPPNPHGLDDATVEARRRERTAYKALVGELPEELRNLRVAVLIETLSAGSPANPAAVTAVLSAHDDRADQPMRWTRDHVEELLWIGIDDFCREYDLPRPEGCPEALHAILGVATRCKLLAPGSDRTCELFGPVRQLCPQVA